jgi:hypothetical protein
MANSSGRIISGAAFALLAVCLASCPFPSGPEWTKVTDPKSTIEGGGGFIPDYNLQAYVQIPVRGAIPVKTITSRADMDIAVIWRDESGPLGDDFTAFRKDAKYTADIILTAKEGYFFAPISFRYYPETAVEIQPAINVNSTRRVLSPVTYKKTEDPNSLNNDGLDLSLRRPAPVGGVSPVTSFYSGDYGGIVTWKTGDGTPLEGTFLSGSAYIAEVTLYAAAGYTLGSGLVFTYEGSGTLNPSFQWTNNNSTITGMKISFPMASSPPDVPVTDMNLAAKVPAPVMGGVPVTYFSAPQYTGTVTWMRNYDDKPHTGLFVAGIVYRAEVQLTPAPGYYLTAQTGQGFTHSAPGVSTINSDTAAGKVTIVFPGTTSVGVKPVDAFDLTAWVPAPVNGGAPVTYFVAEQYTGNVAWTVPDETGAMNGFFRAGSSYTARVALTAASGYFIENGAVFTHSATSNMDTDPGTNVVTIKFGPAGAIQVPATDLDLTYKFAAPVRGGTPTTTFAAVQYTGAVTWEGPSGGLSGNFLGGVEYTARVELTAASGWDFTGLGDGYFTYNGTKLTAAGSVSASAIVFRIPFPKTASEGEGTVTDRDLTYKVSAPAPGKTPVTYFAAVQYTGDVAWTSTSGGSSFPGIFEAGTAYTAIVTLNSASYNLDVAIDFVHNGDIDSIIYDPSTRQVAIRFNPVNPAGDAPQAQVTGRALTAFVPRPVPGGYAIIRGFSAEQYMGNITEWTEKGVSAPLAENQAFAGGKEYTATVTLQARTGWTFTGLAAVHFTHTEGTVTGGEGSGNEITVNIEFPRTADSSSGGGGTTPPLVEFPPDVKTFAGPTVNESAIGVIREAGLQGVVSALSIQLSKDTDTEYITLGNGNIGAGLNLLASSPLTTVIIDGQGRTVNLQGTSVYASPVITVGKGVTLVLKDITFTGIGNNTAPLIRVNGGRLTLEDGAHITNNTNTNSGSGAEGGGIAVLNGGILTMNGSSTISGNTANFGGGVAVLSGGILTMNGNSSIDTNETVNGSGGGVWVDGTSSLTMYDSSQIRANKANIGGGVAVNNGSLTMYDNSQIHANGVTNLGGGVRAVGSSITMAGGSHIANNTAAAQGGGISIKSGKLVMSGAGTISVNSAVDGGGIYLEENGNGEVVSVSMSGNAAIQDNKAETGRGGGVCASEGNDANFTMSGGFIRRNTAGMAGGVFAANMQFLMNGGEISGNSASAPNGGGGGVHLIDTGKFTMTGGRITGNLAIGIGSSGGGVFIVDSGAFLMNGGEISGNRAGLHGGGVYFTGDNGFLMNAGTITGNRAGNGLGGGLYVDGAGPIQMTGGTISGNTSGGSGGGFYAAHGTGDVTIAGGTISGNTSDGSGGGLYVARGGPVTITGGTTIVMNESGGSGGGLYVVAGTGAVRVNGGSISNNIAGGDGGGGFLETSAREVTASGGAQITGNTAVEGSGLYVDGKGDVAVSDS